MPFTTMLASGVRLRRRRPRRSTNRPASSAPSPTPPTGSSASSRPAARSSSAWSPGIIPTLIVLLTGVNALIRLIGPERIDKLGEVAARPGLQYYPVRYLVLPVLSVFFLTNPMAYTMGRFLPEQLQARVLRLGGQLRAPDHRHLPARQRR